MPRFPVILLLLIIFSVFMATTIQYNCAQAATPADEAAEVQYGDANQDGATNIFDLLTILRQMSGLAEYTESADLNGNGKIDIFDLLAFLRLLKDIQEPLEVAVTINQHLLTEPVVYSYAGFNSDNQVCAPYHIYSSREISRVELVLDGDTLTEISGTTPVLFEADPDTIERSMPEDFSGLTETKPWKITVWDNTGNSVSDSGGSQFQFLYPGICIDVFFYNVGEEIQFPLTLKGTPQRFGITTGIPNYETSFTIDLNPEGQDSVVFQDIDQLAGEIKNQLVNNPMWLGKNIYGEDVPCIFVCCALSRETGKKTNRLIMVPEGSPAGVRMLALDGNSELLSSLGYTAWKQEAIGYLHDLNFTYDIAFYEGYY